MVLNPTILWPRSPAINIMVVVVLTNRTPLMLTINELGLLYYYYYGDYNRFMSFRAIIYDNSTKCVPYNNILIWLILSSSPVYGCSCTTPFGKHKRNRSSKVFTSISFICVRHTRHGIRNGWRCVC